jgi:hypothetical protein
MDIIPLYSWIYDMFSLVLQFDKSCNLTLKNMINYRLVPSCNISFFRLVWWIIEGYLVDYYQFYYLFYYGLDFGKKTVKFLGFWEN